MNRSIRCQLESIARSEGLQETGGGPEGGWGCPRVSKAAARLHCPPHLLDNSVTSSSRAALVLSLEGRRGPLLPIGMSPDADRDSA